MSRIRATQTTQGRNPGARLLRWAGRLALTLAILGVVWAALYVLPSTFVGPGTDLDAGERAEALMNERRTLITLLVGVGAGIGLYYTAKRHELDRDANRTDRYTKAVEQLGHLSIHIRLGGVYALERTARDSPADGQTITDVLSAFVREETKSVTGAAADPALAKGQHPARRTDVAATLGVLGRLPLANYRASLELANLSGANLRNADLKEADLTEAKLTEAKLWGADLTKADLTGADLAGADLYDADLTKAQLWDADLTKAHLRAADLRGAQVVNANLTGATLVVADLTGAFLLKADLSGADLTEANLSGADLTEAKLSGASLTFAILVEANLTGADLTKADLTEANLAGADLTKAILVDADLRGADLTGADLRGAILVDADLRGADLTGAIGLDAATGSQSQG